MILFLSLDEMDLVDRVARSGQQTPETFEQYLRNEIENNYPDWCFCPLNIGTSKDYVDTIGGGKTGSVYLQNL